MTIPIIKDNTYLYVAQQQTADLIAMAVEGAWEGIHPYDAMLNISGIEPRRYQINIARRLYSGKNYLVVLPTGLGKTLIAVLAIAKALYENKRVLVLAPTKPLSEQHYVTLCNLLNLDKNSILLLTGSTKAKERREMEEKAKVIAATPQTVANDIRLGRLSIKDFGIAVFDECHKAVGRYAYTYVADECILNGIQILGLTASPGSDRKKINQLIDTLQIQDIEIRTSADSDVAPYIKDRSTRVIYVYKGEPVESIIALIRPLIDEHLGKLYSKGLSPFKSFDNLPKKRILEIGENINRIEAQNYKFMAFFHYIYLINLAHAYELISVEGIYPFLSYLEGIQNREKKSRAVNSMLANKEVQRALAIAKEAMADGIEHPKMLKVVELLQNDLRGKSAIVFAQYRSTIKRLADILQREGISARAFVGKKEGVTQEAQRTVLEDFRNRCFDVLVSTSIGEEGLDIPAVDAVIFYEPIPSEIRTIQRKGRAGRIKVGYIAILVTRGTRDETYLMISRVREKRMHDNIDRIKISLGEKSRKDALAPRSTEEGQKRLF